LVTHNNMGAVVLCLNFSDVVRGFADQD
jgi:hypothetical protein